MTNGTIALIVLLALMIGIALYLIWSADQAGKAFDE